MAPVQLDRRPALRAVRAADAVTEGPVHAERQPDGGHVTRVLTLEERMRPVRVDLGCRSELGNARERDRQREVHVGPVRDADVGVLHHAVAEYGTHTTPSALCHEPRDTDDSDA